MAVTYTFTNGTTADADEVNVNFKQSYYQGAFGTVLNHASVDVSNTETLIVAANASRYTVLIKNTGTASVFIGNTGVAISDGFELEFGESILLYNQDAIYGITDATTEDVRYLEAE